MDSTAFLKVKGKNLCLGPESKQDCSYNTNN